jgi:hypothetical protein
LSHEDAGSASSDGSTEAAEEEAEKEVEAFLETVGDAGADRERDSRQTPAHKKIDEQILTGPGMLE